MKVHWLNTLLIVPGCEGVAGEACTPLAEIVNTHSADDTGDLWFTSMDIQSNGPAVTKLDNVRVLLTNVQ